MSGECLPRLWAPNYQGNSTLGAGPPKQASLCSHPNPLGKQRRGWLDWWMNTRTRAHTRCIVCLPVVSSISLLGISVLISDQSSGCWFEVGVVLGRRVAETWAGVSVEGV